MFMAVAVTGEKAKSKVHLNTGLPYDELYAVLVRRDEKPIDPKDWNPGLETCLGDVKQFTPRGTRPCAFCDGRGFNKVWDGPCNADWDSEDCERCEGTGVRLRRSRTVPP